MTPSNSLMEQWKQQSFIMMHPFPSEELDASHDADSVLAFSALRVSSLVSSLAITSVLSLILVVGPHRSLLSPGPI